MIRNLRALGIAFVAVFAMSAVAASAAHATAAHFKANTGAETAEIKFTADPNEPTQTFKTHAGNVTCPEVHGIYKGLATTASATFTEIKYTECELAGLAATVNFEGVAGKPCGYTLTAGNTETEPGKSTGNVTLEPAGCKVIINTLKCTVTVEGEQEFKESITYQNVKTSFEEITANATVKGIKYTTSATCPGGGGPFNNGEYNGKITAKGYTTAGTQVNLTLEDT